MDWFFYYIIYSFLGYICEVVYVSTLRHKLTNRGYLFGPICPIYGYGALIVIAMLYPLYDYWYLVFFLGILLTSSLEYVTSFVLETFFHMRWWDYSDKKLNIKGRVCIRNSLLFGLLVMAVIYFLHPIVLKILGYITDDITKWILFCVLLVINIVDTILSTIRHMKAASIVDKIKSILADKINLPTKEKFIEYINNTKIVMFFKKYNNRYNMLVSPEKGKDRVSLKDFVTHFKENFKKKDDTNQSKENISNTNDLTNNKD